MGRLMIYQQLPGNHQLLGKKKRIPQLGDALTVFSSSTSGSSVVCMAHGDL